jgi:hypothetical protein
VLAANTILVFLIFLTLNWGEFIRRPVWTEGDVAQLGERSVRNAEVVGSNPIVSTMDWQPRP